MCQAESYNDVSRRHFAFFPHPEPGNAGEHMAVGKGYLRTLYTDLRVADFRQNTVPKRFIQAKRLRIIAKKIPFVHSLPHLMSLFPTRIG